MTLATRGDGDRATEWLFALMMVTWGAYLLLPLQTFSAPHYAPLAAIAGEPLWGAFSLSIGGLRVLALYINGRHHATPTMRCVGAIFGILWWLTLFVLFVVRVPNPPAGVMMYPIFLAFEALAVFRAGADINVSRRRRRPVR